MSLKDQLASIFDVFSLRSPARGKGYKPDEFPEPARRRILILYRDVVAGQWQTNEWSSNGNHTAEFWAEVHNSLEHLYGRVRLSSAATNTQMDDAIAFVLHGTPAEFFDFLELSFRVQSMWRILHEKNELVDAINEILRVEDAPYQLTRVVTREEPGTGHFRQGATIHTVAWPRVIRVEDEVTYAEAVAPALSVLSASHFEAANLEFLDALDEYRKGHFGDSVTKCCSAFESVLKVLCTRNGWAFDPQKDTAAKLLDIVLSHSSLDGFFSQPLMLIATMRNRLSSAHGGGTAVRAVDRHVAQYALTSTAAAVVLLVHDIGG